MNAVERRRWQDVTHPVRRAEDLRVWEDIQGALAQLAPLLDTIDPRSGRDTDD